MQKKASILVNRDYGANAQIRCINSTAMGGQAFRTKSRIGKKFEAEGRTD